VSRNHDKQPDAAGSKRCDQCLAAEYCFLGSPFPGEAADCAAIVQRRFPLATNQVLFRRGARFTSVFMVSKGALKTQRVTADGNLIVTGFHLAGDIVGLEAMGEESYGCDALATTDSEICSFSVSRLLSHCSRQPGLQEWILARIGASLRSKDATLCNAKGLSGHHRILRFFLELHDRLELRSGDAGASTLPMRKQDIAVYLNLAPETLSRNLARLREDGLLLVEADRFTLPNLELARQLTRI